MTKVINKTNILIVLIIILYSLTLYANQPCTLDKSTALESSLNHKDSRVQKSEPPKKYLDDKRLKESIWLKDGTKVIFDVGGCDHYSYSFTYENIKDVPVSDSKKLIKLATTLFLKTPNLKEVIPLKSVLIQSQSLEAPIQNNTLYLPCGDAVCSIEIKSSSSLMIQYDFPL